MKLSPKGCGGLTHVGILRSCASCGCEVAGSISEPGLVMQGVVSGTSRGDGRVSSGVLWWTPTAYHVAFVVLPRPQNLRGQFSYRARGPFERLLGSGTAFPRPGTRTNSNLSQVTVNGLSASMTALALGGMEFYPHA